MKYKDQFEKAIDYQLKKYGGDKEYSLFLAQSMTDANVDPAFIYAVCKTGLLPMNMGNGKTNIDWRPKKDKDEFYAAVEEFKSKNNL